MTKEELYNLKKSFGLANQNEVQMHEDVKKITVVSFSDTISLKGEPIKSLMIDVERIYSTYGVVDYEKGSILSLDNEEIPILQTNKQGKIVPVYNNAIQIGKKYVIPHYISNVDWTMLSNEKYNNIKKWYLDLLRKSQQKGNQKVFK